MSTRFQDDGRTIWDFMGDILVECPGCGACAHVLPKDPRHASYNGPRRVTCLRCGYARDASDPRAAKAKARPSWQQARRMDGHPRQGSTSFYPPRPTDTFLDLPLYLQTPCAGHTFWALNPAHLAWLESFLAADLREDVSPVRRKTAVSALPQWLILARRRDEALRAAARLRARLLE
ncbi:MAG TPA: hypothetical protein VF808_16455 [Ktedonobacterales bacterium]